MDKYIFMNWGNKKKLEPWMDSSINLLSGPLHFLTDNNDHIGWSRISFWILKI